MADARARNHLIEKVAIGSVQFGIAYGISNTSGKTAVEEVAKIMKLAHHLGIDLVDTAVGYGDSEKVLGEISDTREFKIVSKFPAPESSGSISDFLQQSLHRLKVSRLYGYMAHNADIFLNAPGLWSELQLLRQQGLVSKIGYSLYTPAQLHRLLDLKLHPDIVQVPYNIIDRRFENDFAVLKSMGVEIHTRSSYLQGLFFLDPERLSTFFDPVKPYLRKLRDLYPSTGKLAGTLLSFCVNNPHVDRVVTGVNTATQLKENIESITTNEFSHSLLDFQNINEDILLPYKWPNDKFL